jgi:CBS domain-containing protein
MIRDRDLWMGAYRQRAPLAAVVASTAMSRGGVTCSPNEEIAAVAQRMQQSPGMRCAAVINERGEFLGLVTLGRIAACRYSSP